MAYMSQEGYDNMVAELKRLESIERPKASAAIAEARDKGDLSENSEYDAAKEKQQQEYIEVAVCSREEAIFVTRPTQTESAVSFGGCKEGFER